METTRRFRANVPVDLSFLHNGHHIYVSQVTEYALPADVEALQVLTPGQAGATVHVELFEDECAPDIFPLP